MDGVTNHAEVGMAIEKNLAIARERLAMVENEGQLGPVQSWRAAYRATGTNPTKYRMAAESILRRIRTRNDFPVLHPLVMLCNSVSARYALPVAVLDAEKIVGDLSVQYSEGGEQYDGFDGSQISLPSGEVTFRDTSGKAHARKWSHKQSCLSAVSDSTRKVVIFAEAVHDDAANDLLDLESVLIFEIRECWPSARIANSLLEHSILSAGVEF